MFLRIVNEMYIWSLNILNKSPSLFGIEINIDLEAAIVERKIHNIYGPFLAKYGEVMLSYGPLSPVNKAKLWG